MQSFNRQITPPCLDDSMIELEAMIQSIPCKTPKLSFPLDLTNILKARESESKKRKCYRVSPQKYCPKNL